MKIALTGSTGLVGRALTQQAEAEGIEVVPVVRSTSADGIYWQPADGEIDKDSFVGIDKVVHIAGENVGEGRWTADKKRKIRDSRVEGTKLLAQALADLPDGPKTLVSASAIGFYGSRGKEIMTEDSSPGTGFLAEVCKDWEAANQVAKDAGIRVVQMRIGVVLARNGGALAKMLTPFKMGVGGQIGNGQQYMSWIALDDVVGAILFALHNDSVQGAVNTVAPNPVTNKIFTKTLGRVLSRWTIFPIPKFMARMAFGEMADDLLLSSTRVAPKKLTEAGFQFELPTLEAALLKILT